MIVSVNEIEASVLKAARGAGMEWGLAEEAARAAGWLAARSLDATNPIVAVLDAYGSRAAPVWDGACLRPAANDGWLDPIAAGAFLSDRGVSGPMIFERILCPVLLLPFAGSDGPVEVKWDGIALRLAQGGVAVVAGDPGRIGAMRAERVSIRPSRHTAAPPEPAIVNEADIDDCIFARLNDYGARTYVPASLHSRAVGAGAGNSDND